jgi:pimeloyl-ACP methyl ester carboxylesterase
MTTPTLPPAVSGERFEFSAPGTGRLSAYVAGEGPPLLLVHSINAAASAAEMRPLHEHYRAARSVFSLELPGYGFAERGDRPYTPRLMTDAIRAMTDEIRRRCGGGSIDALALSLSSEFLARAALESPAAYRSLALVSPTGFEGGRERSGAPGSTLARPWLYGALRGPGWGGTLFRGLTRPGVIRYFLRRTWGADQIDEDLCQYCVLTTRQPGAEFAPLCFLGGGLFSADIHSVYDRLELPVWVSHGVRGDFTNYRRKTGFAQRTNWSFTVFETGAMPHFEAGRSFTDEYEAFLGSIGTNRRRASSDGKDASIRERNRE